MINLTTNRAKQRAVARVNRELLVFERIYFTKIRNELDEQYRAAARVVKTGSREVWQVVNDRSMFLQSILREMYARVTRNFGDMLFEDVEKFNNKKSIHVKQSFLSEYDLKIRNWSELYAAKKIKQIDRTTKKLLAAIIAQGIDEGLGNVGIAALILEKMPTHSRYRAFRIARTESHTAATTSMNEAMKSTGLRYSRTWVSAKDKRSRKKPKNMFDHFHKYPTGADGETIAREAVYVGTGEALKYPGDPDGSAANIIHCRCIEVFNTNARI